jgi:hypothetical protein
MRKAILLALALPALALPAGAAAQNVPPGNSAAAQYTETFPTSQGEQDAQGPKKHVDPNKVIGSEKTKKLEAQGPEGAAVAEFTAETAPATSAPAEEPSGGGESGAGNGGGKQGGGNKGDGGKESGGGQASGKGQGNGGGEETSEAGGTAPAGAGNSGGGSGSGPSGSSAVGQVASQATGVSSGALGLWLPIALVAVLAWAAFYFWRRREGPERAV